MTSLKNTNTIHPIFNQKDYTNTFYYCSNHHPFIAFTTCFCPLCEKEDVIRQLDNELEETESNYDQISEDFAKLVHEVSKTNPELVV